MNAVDFEYLHYKEVRKKASESVKRKSHISIAVWIIVGFFTISIVMVALLPLFSTLAMVEIKETNASFVTIIPENEAPEEQLLTVLYEQEADSKEISAIYIEVFQPRKETIYYMEIPVQTKIMLSNELYKSLQTYSPELPQYLKLSKMAEGFSKDYALTGCNRILSELLGISLEHYVSGETESLQHWMETLGINNTKKEFFGQYAKWLEVSVSDLSNKERWIYYESYQKITKVEKKLAAGNQEVGEFIISSKQCKELIEHWKYLLRIEE